MSNGKPKTAPATVPVIPSANPAALPDRSSAASERVLAAFQETMRTFLEVQRTTMLAYLSGRQQHAHGPSGAARRRGSAAGTSGLGSASRACRDAAALLISKRPRPYRRR